MPDDVAADGSTAPAGGLLQLRRRAAEVPARPRALPAVPREQHDAPDHPPGSERDLSVEDAVPTDMRRHGPGAAAAHADRRWVVGRRRLQRGEPARAGEERALHPVRQVERHGRLPRTVRAGAGPRAFAHEPRLPADPGRDDVHARPVDRLLLGRQRVRSRYPARRRLGAPGDGAVRVRRPRAGGHRQQHRSSRTTPARSRRAPARGTWRPRSRGRTARSRTSRGRRSSIGAP